MTKRDSAFRIPIPALFWAAAVAVVYFAGLTMPLVGPDEPRYAQVAREMFERGDWITPTLGGFHWFEKPALLYWLQIISFNLFGVSEFAARFGSALFGFGTILTLWLLGRNVEAENAGEESYHGFANLLALTSATTVGIIAFAHGASFDIILTFPITAAMVSFFIYDISRRTSALIAFYVFVGLALLAKGLVGIFFPFAIAGFYHLLVWRMPDRRLIASAFWGTALATGVAALWYLPMYLRHGYEFIDHFFIQHHFQRFTSNKYLHPQPFHFFFWVLPLMTIPWLPFFFAALWDLRRTVFSNDIDRSSIPYRLRLFSIAWLSLPLVFFSFSGSKLPGYVLPAVPAAIILATDFLHRFVRKSSLRLNGVYATAAITLLLSAIAGFVFAPQFARTDSVKSLFDSTPASASRETPVFMLHGISYNAEFYAAGRIVREPDGKQKRLQGPKEVVNEMRIRGLERATVLVPVEYAGQLLNEELLVAHGQVDNGDFVLVEVSLRQ
jgi:4-amino-4-deoxy-L-arabinose transferase-like glycosyltransferase